MENKQTVLRSTRPPSCKRNYGFHRPLIWNPTHVELNTGWNFSCKERLSTLIYLLIAEKQKYLENLIAILWCFDDFLQGDL